MKNLIFLYFLLFACQGLSAQYAISGHVTREDQVPVPNAGVILSLDDNTVLDTVNTDLAGNYIFENLPAGNYIVSAFKQGNDHNGVTLKDAYLVAMHILGIQPMTSVNYSLYSDINASATITTLDIVEIKKFILYDNGGCSTCFLGWHVLREGVDAQEPDNVSTYSITLNADYENINFTAYKVGDVNLSNNPAE
jgi:hypothetical protein